MMIFRVSLMLSLVLLSGLSGCRYLTCDDCMFRDRQSDYLAAPVLPDMQIPENLDRYTLDELYVVPQRADLATEDFLRAPMPRPIETSFREGVVIQRFDGRSWVVVDAAPGQVWPRVRDYWTESAVQLDYENPVQGIMDTSWIDSPGDITTQEKVRVLIEPGLHPGTSEVYVRQITRPRGTDEGLATWPEESDSDARELLILQDISQYLADRNDIYQASSVSLLAGSIVAESKAQLREDETGANVLELRIGSARAWAQVGQALDGAGIEVLESDRDGAWYRVNFSGSADENETGFIGRLFGGGDEEETEGNVFTVRLIQQDEVIDVVIEAANETEAGSALGADLLSVINQNLR